MYELVNGTAVELKRRRTQCSRITSTVWSRCKLHASSWRVRLHKLEPAQGEHFLVVVDDSHRALSVCIHYSTPMGEAGTC